MQQKQHEIRTLRGFNGVYPVLPSLGPDYLVGRGQVHVADAGDGDAALGQDLVVVVVGQQGLKLGCCHLECA